MIRKPGENPGHLTVAVSAGVCCSWSDPVTGEIWEGWASDEEIISKCISQNTDDVERSKICCKDIARFPVAEKRCTGYIASAPFSCCRKTVHWLYSQCTFIFTSGRLFKQKVLQFMKKLQQFGEEVITWTIPAGNIPN